MYFEAVPYLEPNFLTAFFVLREEDRESHQLVEVWNPPFQSYDQLGLADGLDAKAGNWLLAGNDLVGILDSREEVGVFRFSLGVDRPLPGVDEVLSRHRIAVRPLIALAQGKSIGLPVFGDFFRK